MTGILTRINMLYRDFGMRIGNMVEMLSCEASKQEGNWIEVEERELGVFSVVDENITMKYDESVTENVALGFAQWDGEVEDLDAGNSEGSQCFGISNHLKWQDVDLTPEEFRAPSIERLKEALNPVAVCVWCPDEI